ncbi:MULTISPECIES: VOC family protein [unclassified Amycolatopsis]|uniref:VOC family protein n=1 Tax=unclassified Amycolatopsis TaxID=2618356 RepID=UPI001FF6CEDA|nr:VOC family protein [Amycolatopsis sp. FBCC-B4732]UOX87600.1 VOC family protein [Amycolatopsis sp. FBCC-B4732]
MSGPRVFRMIQPVDDVEVAVAFYAAVLGQPGERIALNRHYFRCGDVVLACVEAPPEHREPRPGKDPRIVYLAVDDVDETYERVQAARPRWIDDAVETQFWGERSFYADDPFGNPLCFVQEDTRYSGGPVG